MVDSCESQHYSEIKQQHFDSCASMNIFYFVVKSRAACIDKLGYVMRHDRDVVIMLVGVGGEVDEAGDVMSE